MASQMLWNVVKGWKEKQWVFTSLSELEDSHQVCSFMWADNYWILSHKKENAEQMTKELVEEVERWDMAPKPVCGGQALVERETRRTW